MLFSLSNAAMRSAGPPPQAFRSPGSQQRLGSISRQRLGSSPTLTSPSLLIQAPSACLCMLQELRIASSHCVVALRLAVLATIAQDRQRDPHPVAIVHGQVIVCPPYHFCKHHHVAMSDVPCPARGWGGLGASTARRRCFGIEEAAHLYLLMDRENGPPSDLEDDEHRLLHEACPQPLHGCRTCCGHCRPEQK